MLTIWEVALMLNASIISFLNGVKDSIVGIFFIYHLDRRLKQLNDEKLKRMQDVINAHERFGSHRRTRKYAGYYFDFVFYLVYKCYNLRCCQMILQINFFV